MRKDISIAELARRVGTSPQNLNAKVKRESFTVKELDEIARVTDCVFERIFILNNNDSI